MAGGTAAFAATGNGTSGSGNLTITGSNVNATDVVLAAKNQINLVNTTDTGSTRSTNQSSSGSIGVSVGTGGFAVDASASRSNGNANAEQNNTHVTAAAADGLGRPGSMFDVTVPQFNNNRLIPFINQALPYGTNQGILLFGVGTKGMAVINDIHNTGGPK
jgi:hypothetical protein